MSRPGHQVSNRRLPPFPGHSSQIVWTKKSGTNLQNWQWDADGRKYIKLTESLLNIIGLDQVDVKIVSATPFKRRTVT